MKKQIYILAIVFFVIAINTHAHVWRVNNTPGVNANFSTFTAAHSSSSVLAGDTLYMEPGAGTYGDVTLTKKLIIIGNGYFLSENPETQANIASSQFGGITLNNGCQGTVIQGCQFLYVLINTSNIVLQRNYMLNPNSGQNPNYGIIFNTPNISNIIIRNNYLINSYNGSYYGDNKTICSNVSGVNNTTISNNYIIAINTYGAARAILLSSGFSGTIENNVIYGYVEINNSVFRNNILITGTFSQTNCTYTNNLGNATQFGTAYGNQSNVNMTNVFLGPTGNSTDGQWQLKAGSPAIGAGVDGIDCGMYGGQFPYMLSGLPAIPAIYYNQQVINNVNQQINVNVKTKSHN